MKKATILVNTGRDSLKQQGAVNPPIYQTSSVLFPTLREYHEAEAGNSIYDDYGSSKSDPSYGISGTSTTVALQKALCELEGGDACLITPSGLSAITMTLSALTKAGDHILIADTVYGPTRRFCSHVLKRYGVEITYYDPLIGAGIDSLIQENTKAIFMESPGSLTFEMQDAPAIVEVAKAKNITTIIDSSWASALFYNPIEHGVDIVIQALTKYISGHADVLLGAVICRDSCKRNLIKAFKNYGISTSPRDCYMALRGLRTLKVRMESQQKSAIKVAKWFEDLPQVSRVLYPALASDPGYEIWQRDFTGAASLFSVVLDKHYPKDELYKITDRLKLFSAGCSWGGFESLVLDFDPSAVRAATKWQAEGSCVRFYIGLEDADDLIADLKQAFGNI